MLYVGRLHHGNETRGDTHECCTAEPARSCKFACYMWEGYITASLSRDMPPHPRAATSLAGGQELAAFVTSHYIIGYEPRPHQAPDLQRCATSSCGLANWVIQLQELTLRLHRRSGEHFSVHVYSPCAPLLKDLQRVSTEQTPLVLHRAHAGQHRDLARLRVSQPTQLR